MPTLESVDPGLLFSLFKGEPGTRKSTQALSYPMPQYWFSWDKKMSGILVPARKWGIDMSKLEYDDYDDWDKARVKLERFQTNCPYKTLVFDSITTMADATLRQTRKSKSGTEKGKTIGTIQVDGLEEFNAEAAAISEMIALAKDIHRYFKVNVILIAHVIQTEVKNAKGETNMSRILVTAAKKIAAKIPAICGEIYHFDKQVGSTVRPDAYKLYTVHTGDDYARTAIDLPREIEFNDDPIYPKYILPAVERVRKGE